MATGNDGGSIVESQLKAIWQRAQERQDPEAWTLATFLGLKWDDGPSIEPPLALFPMVR